MAKAINKLAHPRNAANNRRIGRGLFWNGSLRYANLEAEPDYLSTIRVQSSREKEQSYQSPGHRRREYPQPALPKSEAEHPDSFRFLGNWIHREELFRRTELRRGTWID